MSRDDELNRYISLAQELESSTEVQARRRKVDRREQLYHLEWREERREGLIYIVDPAPMTVAQRGEDKLVSQDFVIQCVQSAFMDELALPASAMIDMVAPGGDQQALQEAKKAARDRSDRLEAEARRYFDRLEQQQCFSLARSLANAATVTGFAGPLRLAYDETAQAEPGVLPLYVQALDPRALLVVPEVRAGLGPRIVIYKRRAKRAHLEREGWALHSSEKIDTLEPDSEVTVYDCWEKRRVKSKGQWTAQLWNCIILDGGEYNREFLKPPFNMAVRGLYRIPYVFIPVRPKPYLHEDYPGDTSFSFLDALDTNWEAHNLTLSFMAQLMALSVNPPTLQKTHQPTEIDVVTPGAQNQVMPDEDAAIMPNQFARQDVVGVHQVLEQQIQRSTFAAASYGEGINSMSGLMTGRLQQASQEALTATKNAVEMALADLFNLIAMFAKAYLPNTIFTGNEVFRVNLPGMTLLEQAQMGQNFKALADPRPDGSRFISDESARTKSQIIPDEHEETARIRREQWREIILEQEKAKRVQAAGQIQDQTNAMRAQAATQVEIQRSLAMQQPGPEQMGPGVAQSPLPESAPEQPADFNPMQMQAGV